MVQSVGLTARPIYSLWNIPPKSEIEVFQMLCHGGAEGRTVYLFSLRGHLGRLVPGEPGTP